MIRTLTKRLHLNARSFAVISRVEGDRPPIREETVKGRYAGVLFTIASKNGQLDVINEEMAYIAQLGAQVGLADERARNSETSLKTHQTPSKNWTRFSRPSQSSCLP